MLSALFFGTQKGDSEDPPVQEGHRSIEVLIDGTALQVDVDALAEHSGLFLQIQTTGASNCPLEDFPGGVPIFRQIAWGLSDPGNQPLQVTEENILNLCEAAWLLECPRVWEIILESAYLRSLSSRRTAELLEHLLPFTLASSSSQEAVLVRPSSLVSRDVGLGSEGPGQSQRPVAAQAEEFLRTFRLESAMWQCTERAALEIAARLDSGDFLLGPRLATGSLRACCGLLRLYRKREAESGIVSSALQPVSAMWKNLTDKPLRARVAWDPHLFALHCLRRRLAAAAMPEGAPSPAGVGSALAGERSEDEEARADLPPELCAAPSDGVLLGLAELLSYIDLQRLGPNWAALMVRMLLLVARDPSACKRVEMTYGAPVQPEMAMAKARQTFQDAFSRSPLTHLLVWRDPAPVPVAWLADVSDLLEASQVLLLVLVKFREMEASIFCDIIEQVLLAHFLKSPHCAETVLGSQLICDIVGACFEAAKKAKAPPGTTFAGTKCPKQWEGQHILSRIHALGKSLFGVTFVPQRAFLPPETQVKAWQHEKRARLEEAVSHGPLEPIVVPVCGTCLWDEGLLTLDLLGLAMEAVPATPKEPTLHFGRQVLMRHLWRCLERTGSYFKCEEGSTENWEHGGQTNGAETLHEIWGLACWSLCEDSGLIQEALEYLKGANKELQGPPGVVKWTADVEELLFRLFVALDLSRLPLPALLSIWVPPQVQLVRLLVQQVPAEQFNGELQQEAVAAADSLKSLTDQCDRLQQKLNVVEQRTVMNKSQINEAIILLEEHQRRKRERLPEGPGASTALP